LVASASACHKLWYLHLCAVNHIHVLSYVDHALGFMEDADPVKRGHFTQIILRPEVVLEKGADQELAAKLQIRALPTIIYKEKRIEVSNEFVRTGH
jgi:organic hydroperoxide reductase OsmC/OhrA